MGLGRSLQISATGLNAQETGIQVVGNNLSNINSTSFKSSRADFTNLFYKLISGATAADGTLPGRNPVQQGEGVNVSGTTINLTQGPITRTGVPEDLYIFGGGFFVARDGQVNTFTRNGALTLDANRNLTTSRGFPVQGYGIDDDFNLLTNELTDLNIPLGQKQFGLPTSNAFWGGTLSPSGQVASQAAILQTDPTSATSLTSSLDSVTLGTSGRPLVNDSSGSFAQPITVSYRPRRVSGDLPEATITLNPGDPLRKLTDFVSQSLEIDPTISQPAGNTPGVEVLSDGRLQIIGNLGSSNGFTVKPNDFVVKRVSDGSVGSLNLFFANQVQAPNGESVATNSNFFDSNGENVRIDASAYLESVDSDGSTWRFLFASADRRDGQTNSRSVGNGTVRFDNFGRFASTTIPELSIDLAGRTSTNPLVIKNDFSRAFALSSGSSSLNLQSQDGLRRGTLIEFNVSNNGTIVGVFDNGGTRPLGQVVLARFPNPNGLTAEADSYYSISLSSGEPEILVPGTGVGTVGNGALEASNVDFSDALVSLVGFSVAFSANSRAFSTAQEIMTGFTQSIRQL
ncbi:flagellar hook-basal body complex protein [bacterium]|nr:flagellar hook-basal body complex protein [bacterium]